MQVSTREGISFYITGRMHLSMDRAAVEHRLKSFPTLQDAEDLVIAMASARQHHWSSRGIPPTLAGSVGKHTHRLFPVLGILVSSYSNFTLLFDQDYLVKSATYHAVDQVVSTGLDVELTSEEKRKLRPAFLARAVRSLPPALSQEIRYHNRQYALQVRSEDRLIFNLDVLDTCVQALTIQHSFSEVVEYYRDSKHLEALLALPRYRDVPPRHILSAVYASLDSVVSQAKPLLTIPFFSEVVAAMTTSYPGLAVPEERYHTLLALGGDAGSVFMTTRQGLS